MLGLFQRESRTYRIMEYNMLTLIKWIVAALFGGLALLVAGYTVEYFRPYKRVKTNRLKK